MAVRAMTNATRARLATETEVGRIFDGCELGAIAPLRHWPDIRIYADQSLLGIGDCVFAAGTHHDAIEMNVGDWLELSRAEIGDFAKPAANGWAAEQPWNTDWD
jgi:Ala-tRNA(Pro) deacylase